LANIQEIKAVDKIGSTAGPNELFIACASYEKRCLRASSLIQDYSPSDAIVCWYDEPELLQSRTGNRDKIADCLSSKTQDKTKIQKIPIALRDPLSATDALVDAIKKLIAAKGSLSITIDISVLAKQHLFLLLRKIDRLDEGVTSVRILYSFVGDYGFLRGESVSRGLDEISIVPSFGGSYHLGRRNLLILFLGFEGPRALAVYERYDPDRAVAVIGKPAYKEGWDKFSEKLNEHLLEQEDVGRKFASVSSPIMVSQLLDQLYLEYGKGHNILVCPMGTKMQAVGTYLFCKNRSEVQVVLPTPIENPEKNFSEGVGSTLEFYLPKT